jgi:hypothetical protein
MGQRSTLVTRTPPLRGRTVPSSPAMVRLSELQLQFIQLRLVHLHSHWFWMVHLCATLGTVAADNGVTFSRSLNLDVPTDFGYTGLACGLIGASNGSDCAVLYKTKSALKFKRFASADVN